MDDLEIRLHYQNLYKKYGDSSGSVQYSSLETQNKRFDILTGIGDLEGKRILDFGCGLGHLGEYLRNKGLDCDYNGVDIVPEFINACKQKFSKGVFGTLEDLSCERFDYVFISGVFNNRMKDNAQFLQSHIKSLFELSKMGLAFNMMSKYVDYEDPSLFYIRPEDVFKYIKGSVSPYLTIRNDYLVKNNAPPFDFTVYVFRQGQ
jgi:SAM-dependent methyltransferase